MSAADRPLLLLGVPRSVSTAFDRMVRERGDLDVLTEPFSVAYYDGPDRRSDRYRGDEDPASSYAAIWAEVTAPRRRRLFVKEMAHQLGPLLDAEHLAAWSCSFLVRDPARALPSLAARWPDFTDEEAGYEAQRRAFDLVREHTGTVPPVIDATDLRSDPEALVAAWCRAVGIDFLAGALHWEPGPVSGWERWRDWFAGAEASDGFSPPAGAAPVVPPDLEQRVARMRPHYEHLHRHRLRPTGSGRGRAREDPRD